MLHSCLARGCLLGLALGCSLASVAVRADEVSGEWSGYYTCAQGQTAFTLTVDATGYGTIEFGPHQDNPNIPSGAYQVTVGIEAANVRLDAGEWITRPSGYATVGTDGVLSDDKQAITGRVDNASCSTFELSRQEDGKDEKTVTGSA
ncbi:MAG: hypothetical protein JWR51_101 [Devosia sp.]|uniref:hypothetical protein n=1 Tax=Devosia sp. TaxID=1871048 RepID=UPI002601B7E0|nr:hypothetical protein [Devosia sp.]MDB5526998.1 hypothetical protein [Devosia sp.]